MSGQAGISEAEVMTLNGEQLKTLAKLIHYQEANRMKSMRFSSEKERAQYLRDSLAGFRNTVELIDEAVNLHQEAQHKREQTTEEVALHYLKHVEKFFNMGLREVWSLHLRLELISKVRAFANEYIIPKMNAISAGLAASEALNPAQLQKIKDEAEALVKILTAYGEHHNQVMINKRTPISRNGPKFWKAVWSKFSGRRTTKTSISFDDLVKKHQLKLQREKGPEYGGLFEELEIGKQIEVYDDIVVSSGRPSLLKSKGALVLEGVGAAIVALNVIQVAWDIYLSDHKIETATKDISEVGGSVVGGFAGEFVGAALGSTMAAATIGTETTAAAIASVAGMEVGVVSTGIVYLAATLTGVGAAIAVGALTGWLVGKFFEKPASASKVDTVQAPQSKPPGTLSTHNLRIYVAPMPDGNILAHQLAYRGDPSSSLPSQMK